VKTPVVIDPEAVDDLIERKPEPTDGNECKLEGSNATNNRRRGTGAN
jgi:hypothetical protein